uniref:Uncharacterized protein n=1 Tax=Phlebotomus papatasi TaxID=29031 RepID=A0A1B0D2C0_PHLPP
MAEFLNNLRGKFLGDQMVHKRSLSATECRRELEYNNILLEDAEKNLREIFNNLLKGDETESVKALLGRHTKILVKYIVKLETKGDKTENRVL